MEELPQLGGCPRFGEASDCRGWYAIESELMLMVFGGEYAIDAFDAIGVGLVGSL